MQSALDNFNDSIQRVKHLHGLYNVLCINLTSVVDLSDILRAELMMVISALDRYIHDLTRLGMLECHGGTRPKTESFSKFPVSLSSVQAIASSVAAISSLDGEVRARHRYLSFQHPDKIAEAIRLFSSVSLWEAVGKELGRSAKDIRSALAIIVDRRNKIVHEADADPSYPGQRWPIDGFIVEQMVSEISALVQAIHSVCA